MLKFKTLLFASLVITFFTREVLCMCVNNNSDASSLFYKIGYTGICYESGDFGSSNCDSPQSAFCGGGQTVIIQISGSDRNTYYCQGNIDVSDNHYVSVQGAGGNYNCKFCTPDGSTCDDVAASQGDNEQRRIFRKTSTTHKQLKINERHTSGQREH